MEQLNIISNDCLTGYMFRNHMKAEFPNPFIWHSIDIENFCKLVSEYDRIDFSKIECTLVRNTSDICEKDSMVPKIRIDDKVDVLYYHYVQDPKHRTADKVSSNVRFYDIWQYAIDVYMHRLEKMKRQPLFIWDETPKKWYNLSRVDICKEICALESPYKIIVYSPDVENKVEGNVVFMQKKNFHQLVDASARIIYRDYIMQARHNASYA